MKQLCPFRKSLLVLRNFCIVISIGLIVILTSSLSYGQPIMTSKEGFYFTLKANNYQILDYAIDGPQLKVRWFDIYVNAFDKSNYENFRNDEFKWTQYSQKILAEINKGVASSDFTKIYSYTCDATLDTWESKSNSFPIAQLWSGLQIVKYPLAYNDFTIRYSAWNDKDFDFYLTMDPSKAESFIASRKDNSGNINRKLTAKVIYNIVNKSTDEKRTATNVELGIYIQKIIFFNGQTILGEIKPRFDNYSKFNFNVPPPPPGDENQSNMNSTSSTPIPDAHLVTIEISKDDKVFFNFDNGTDSAEHIRAKVLLAIGRNYQIKFTPKEINKFEHLASFGLPVVKLKNFLNVPDEKIREAMQAGIPIVSTDNQLSMWVRFACTYNSNVLVSINTSKDTSNLIVKEIINTLQNNRVNYNLIKDGKVILTRIAPRQGDKIEIIKIDGNESSPDVFIIVEEQATFLGGDVNSFRDWVKKNIKYPTVATKNGISGRVFVQYAVNSNGEVVDVKVVRGVDPSLDKEAVRVIMSSPLWKPAKQSGTKVKQQFTIPISFNLPANNTK